MASCMPSDRVELELELYYESMLQACANGRLTELQSLFSARYVEQENKPGYPQYPHMLLAKNPPISMSMFINAVENNQLDVLQYLLTIHPQADLDDPEIAKAIVKTKRLDVLQLVVQQSPSIGSLEYDYLSTFLTRLCREGSITSPLVELLLDHGASAEGGGTGFFSPGYIALKQGFPVSTIQKLLDAGSCYCEVIIEAAIKSGRFDAVPMLLDRWHRRRPPLDKRQTRDLREALRTCQDKQTIRLTNKFIGKNTLGSTSAIQLRVAWFFQRLMKLQVFSLSRGWKNSKIQPLSKLRRADSTIKTRNTEHIEKTGENEQDLIADYASDGDHVTEKEFI